MIRLQSHNEIVNSILENSQKIKRIVTNKNSVMLIDHCFSIKGKGTVLTGTVLQG